MSIEPCVDLAFPISGGQVPLDHGYALYSAISSALPQLHGAPWLGIHPLSGRKLTPSTLLLTGGSAVTLRLPASNISSVLGLFGRTLRIDDHPFELGHPIVRPLSPAPSLFAWQVAVRLTRPPPQPDGGVDIAAFKQQFEAEARRQLDDLGLPQTLQVLAKRVIRVKGQRIIAYSAEIKDLTPEQSLLLQVQGLGGKRRMGCGVFRSSRWEGQNQ